MTKKKNETETLKSTESPLVFISHDNRDADLAEAFSKLLKSVSAGMLKSFRSSDKSGTEGIEFGDEWYKRLMSKIETASDVVCLLTERSLDRPWILYEAGVAKGKLGTPVQGVALGIPLSRVSTGPFYQFQNSGDDEESLTKLVFQLCKRVSGLDPDKDVVMAQVRIFKQRVEEVTKAIASPKKGERKTPVDEGTVAKVLEEMKLMVREIPRRIEHGMADSPERFRSRRLRRFNPIEIEEMARVITIDLGEPLGILIIASIVRDDVPWLYEIGVEAYRIAKKGSPKEAKNALRTFRDAAEFAIHGPFKEIMGLADKGMYSEYHRLPLMINRYMQSFDLLLKKKRRGTRIKDSESEE